MKILYLNVKGNDSWEGDNLYEATRYAWKIDPEKASQADLILAVKDGKILGLFEAEKWLPATKENFPDRDPADGRYGFVGREIEGIKFSGNPVEYNY